MTLHMAAVVTPRHTINGDDVVASALADGGCLIHMPYG